MKTSKKFIGAGALALLAVLGLHAQTASSGSSSTSTKPDTSSPSTTQTPASSSVPGTSVDTWTPGTPAADIVTTGSIATNREPVSFEATASSTAVVPETDITAFSKTFDGQGSAAISRIAKQYADIAGSEENARKIVDALVNGTSVTLISGNLESVTFQPAGSKLGYGEAYIALGLAAEALRDAGVTGAATPAQWNAVFLGGPFVAAGAPATVKVSTVADEAEAEFPGILKLHAAGQGWGEIANSTNVQLGTIISSGKSASSSNVNGVNGKTDASAPSDNSMKSTSGTKPDSSAPSSSSKY